MLSGAGSTVDSQSQDGAVLNCRFGETQHILDDLYTEEVILMERGEQLDDYGEDCWVPDFITLFNHQLGIAFLHTPTKQSVVHSIHRIDRSGTTSDDILRLIE